jgi:hypothetical protein
MRPFDVVPNYKEELSRSRQSLDVRRRHSPEQRPEDDHDETTSEILRRTVHDRQPGANRPTIVSASPYRAVLKRRNYLAVPDNGDNDDSFRKSDDENDEEDEEHDFERDLNGQTGIQDTLVPKTGRPYLNKDGLLSGLPEPEPLSAQHEQRKNIALRAEMANHSLLLSGNLERLNTSQMSNAKSVTEDSMHMR